MFNCLYKGILSFIAVKLLANYRCLSLRLLKIEAIKTYLHGVRLARLSALGLMGMGLVNAQHLHGQKRVTRKSEVTGLRKQRGSQ